MQVADVVVVYLADVVLADVEEVVVVVAAASSSLVVVAGFEIAVVVASSFQQEVAVAAAAYSYSLVEDVVVEIEEAEFAVGHPCAFAVADVESLVAVIPTSYLVEVVLAGIVLA